MVEMGYMAQLLKPCEAAKLLGVTRHTLTRWHKSGRIRAQHTPEGHARYLAEDIKRLTKVH